MLVKRSHICAREAYRLEVGGQATSGDIMRILLYQVRTKRGLSAKALARKSGISRTHILRIENKWSNPTLRCLCKLADALDVEVGELFEHQKGDPIL